MAGFDGEPFFDGEFGGVPENVTEACLSNLVSIIVQSYMEHVLIIGYL